MVRRKETGLAIGLILLAIILLVALSLAIAYGIRAGTAGNSDYKNKSLATAVISQAAYIQRAYDDLYSAGVNTCRVRFYPSDAGATDPYTYHYVYDPMYTTVPAQVAPADALVDPAQTWGLRYSLCFGLWCMNPVSTAPRRPISKVTTPCFYPTSKKGLVTAVDFIEKNRKLY